MAVHRDQIASEESKVFFIFVSLVIGTFGFAQRIAALQISHYTFYASLAYKYGESVDVLLANVSAHRRTNSSCNQNQMKKS